MALISINAAAFDGGYIPAWRKRSPMASDKVLRAQPLTRKRKWTSPSQSAKPFQF
jgi:hypothetical protein